MTPPKLNPEEVTRLKAALLRITVYDIWRMLALPGWRNLPEDRRDQCLLSPLRQENNPSFSVHDEGRRWKDFGGGNNAHGDAADFLQAAISVPREIAIRLIVGLVNATGADDPSPDPSQPYDPHADEAKIEERTKWPEFETPTEAEIEAIAELRGLSPEAVALAVKRGLLYCADIPEGRAWVITDSKRCLAQIRRMDGKTLPQNKKAKTLPGSIASWPIGIEEAFNFPAIALVEGGPDLLAAFDGIHITSGESMFAPVAMLGASMDINARALPLFVGTIVKIFIHDDDKGRSAALRWAKELRKAGVKRIDRFSFADLKMPDGTPVKDLNDFVRMGPENPTPEQIEAVSNSYKDAFTAPERR